MSGKEKLKEIDRTIDITAENPFLQRPRVGLFDPKTALFPGYVADSVSRQQMLSLGSALIVTFWLVTMILWTKGDIAGTLAANGPLLATSKFFSLTGFTLLCLNFVLSSRLWFVEPLF